MSDQPVIPWDQRERVMENVHLLQNGETLSVELWYPRAGPISGVEVALTDVRAADSVLVRYDFERDGWVILQAGRFAFKDEDDTDEDWQDVAFIQAWARQHTPPPDDHATLEA